MTPSFISRQLNLLDYALGTLMRKGMKNLGIFIIFSLLIFLLSSFQLITTALEETADRVLTSVPDITVQQMSGGRQVPMATDALHTLNSIFGIKTIRQRIWGYYFDENNGANYTVIGMEHPENAPSTLGAALASGRFPQPGEIGGVVLGEGVRQSKELGDRRSFSLFRPDLTMISLEKVGVFATGTSLVTDDLILMSIADARDLFAMDAEEITDLLISTGNPAETDTIAKKIAETLPGSRVLTSEQIRKTYHAVFGWRSGVGSVCLLAALFAFVILAWDKASGLSAEEAKEVGILKVLGWQTRDIMTIRFWESGIVAGLAFLVGYSLSWIHVVWADGLFFQPVLLGWSILSPSYSLVPALRFSDLLLTFSFSVVPYLGATIVPAWRSSTIRPDTVI